MGVDLGIEGVGEGELIGSGGSGRVYRATQLTLGRPVAIKVMDRGYLDREAELLARAGSHPAVVTVHDVGENRWGQPYLVMELLEGGSLADRVANGGPLGVDEALAHLADLLDALGHVHDMGLVHADIKPENLLLDGQGRVRLADFGVTTSGVTRQSDDLVGTIVHTAPEVLDGELPTVACDLWSVGSTLHTLLSGRPPFASGGSEAADIVSVLTKAPAPLPPGVPAALAGLVAELLDKDPAGRPSRAEVADRVAAMRGEAALSGGRRRGDAVSPPGLGGRGAAALSGGRRRGWVLVLGLSMLALGAWWLAGSTGDGPTPSSTEPPPAESAGPAEPGSSAPGRPSQAAQPEQNQVLAALGGADLDSPLAHLLRLYQPYPWWDCSFAGPSCEVEQLTADDCRALLVEADRSGELIELTEEGWFPMGRYRDRGYDPVAARAVEAVLGRPLDGLDLDAAAQLVVDGLERMLTERCALCPAGEGCMVPPPGGDPVPVAARTPCPPGAAICPFASTEEGAAYLAVLHAACAATQGQFDATPLQVMASAAELLAREPAAAARGLASGWNVCEAGRSLWLGLDVDPP